MKPRSKSEWIPAHGPGLDLHLAGGEERLQPQQPVGGLGEHLQTGALEPEGLQVFGGLLRVELGQLRLDLGADGDGGDAVDGREVLAQHVLVHVRHVQDRLHGQQEEPAGGGTLLVGHVERRRAVALVQPAEQAAGDLELRGELMVALRVLLELGKLLLERLDVGEDELGHDGLGIARRVDELAHAPHLAHDVGVLEVADHLADGVGLADVREELVAQALALVGALHQARDVHELDGGRHDAPGMDDLGQLAEAVVGHVDDPHVGIDRGERVVGGQAALLGERGEQRRFAHVGQADDTD